MIWQIKPGSKELVAIFLAEDGVDVLSLLKGWAGRWRLGSLSAGGEDPRKIGGSGLRALEEFLHGLPARKDRGIHIGLPRNKVFVRTVFFPPMALEDAMDAVRNALPVHCHLALSEVYADVRVHRLRDGSVQATVAYIPRKNVEGLLAVVADTGHAEELQGLFPASFGWVSWLRWQGIEPPAAVVVPDGEEMDVMAMDASGRVHPWVLPLEDGETPERESPAVILEQVGIPQDRVFSVDARHGHLIPTEGNGRVKWPHPVQHPATLVAAVALDRRFDFCLNGSPPRLRLFHPAKVVVPWMLFLAVTGWALTEENARKVHRLQGRIEKVSATIQSLEQQLDPLKKNVEEMHRVRTLLAGAEGFMGQRPKFYSFFNDLALRCPEGTWITNVNYGQGQFVLQMVSPDSIKVLEALRASSLVKDVQIRGAVNRRSDGKETFQVVIELKK